MEKVNLYEYCYKKGVNPDDMKSELMCCLTVLELAVKKGDIYKFSKYIDLYILDKASEMLEYKKEKGFSK